jgi:acetyl-CoA acyltransferase
MGQNAERLVKRLEISRTDQDDFALSSHHRAARAEEDGRFRDHIVPTRFPPNFAPVTADNGIRGDSTAEKLASLRPAFDRRFGSVTAGNSSYLTDGASAVLLASEAGLRRTGLTPLARVRAQALVAMDPLDELLLGPALAVPRALRRAGLALAEIDVLEFHEAFAGQVLAVIKQIEDDPAGGTIDRDRLNAWGGSLSIGHPFGATGGRLVTTCCRRLIHDRGRYGLVAACASGALGYALVLERVPS